jgi:glycosyltransferase involved in cell wall biosynthesis
MSMLDAAACGLPIVVNDTMAATERIDGNGLTYRKDDVEDLVQVLHSLGSSEKRLSLGQRGAEKMQKEFSWEAIARRRLCDYEMSLNGHPR